MTLKRKNRKQWVNKTLLAIPCDCGKVVWPPRSSKELTLPAETRSIRTVAEGGGRPGDDEAEINFVIQDLLDGTKGWMQECEAKHPDCELSRESQLPIRVFDVRARRDANQVRLVECNEQQHGRYVALSYVWGTKPTLRLLESTRDALMDGIPLQNFPKTLQDAVQVTRTLGIQYLWIDSLRILQDSDADTELQIPHMNEYYREAIAIISASGVLNIHTRFLNSQITKG